MPASSRITPPELPPEKRISPQQNTSICLKIDTRQAPAPPSSFRLRWQTPIPSWLQKTLIMPLTKKVWSLIRCGTELERTRARLRRGRALHMHRLDGGEGGELIVRGGRGGAGCVESDLLVGGRAEAEFHLGVAEQAGSPRALPLRQTRSSAFRVGAPKQVGSCIWLLGRVAGRPG